LRLRALPLTQSVREFIEQHDRIYVVENNTDGQMARLIHMEYPDLANRVRPVAYSDGLPLSPRWMVETILEQEQ
jgi:2-oxoglutarate ferredoxin oxidoreductase subunit alpha